MSEYTVGKTSGVYCIMHNDRIVTTVGEEGRADFYVKVLNREFVELQTELATANSALSTQSETIARMRQELDAAAQLLQEANERVAHRDELLRIQSGTCERYKQGIQDAEDKIGIEITALRKQEGIYSSIRVDGLRAALDILSNALNETNATSKETLSPTPNGEYDEYWNGLYGFLKDTGQHNALIAALTKALTTGWILHEGENLYRIRKDAPDYLMNIAIKQESEVTE